MSEFQGGISRGSPAKVCNSRVAFSRLVLIEVPFRVPTLIIPYVFIKRYHYHCVSHNNVVFPTL